MLAIRLQRRGRKNDPSFRVIVTDSKRPPQSGKYLEMVGSYDPRVDRVDLKAERVKHWLQHGAQASDTVHNLLVSGQVIEGKKINVLPKKILPKKEESENALSVDVNDNTSEKTTSSTEEVIATTERHDQPETTTASDANRTEKIGS